MTVQHQTDQGAGWRALLEAVPLPALRVAAGGVVVAVNGAWEALSGLDEDASMGTGWTGVVVTADRLSEELAEAVASRASGSRDHQVCVDGEPAWCRWWWRPVTGEGLVVGVASIEADRAREQQLWFRATHDPLTELTNRAEFLAVVERALHRGRRRRRPPAVIYIDLDGFKAVNDDGGHRLGDQILRSFAQRLSDAVRPADVAARVGGDEFAVVCEDLTSTAGAEQLAGRIRSAMELPVWVADRTVHVHATTGVAFAAVDDDPESLLSRADLDMYANKHRRVRPPLNTWPVAATTSPVRRSSATGGNGDPARGVSTGPGDPLLADWLVNRVFEISLELHVAASAIDGHECGLVDGVAENLDRLIVDVRLGAFDARHRGDGPAVDPGSKIARAGEALDEAIEHLRHAWTTVAGDIETRELGDRLSHAVHLARSAARVLSSEVVLR